MTSNDIAATIFRQLGGNKFRAMTGMKNSMTINNGLQFDIPTTNKINRVQIVLTGADLYTMAFYRYRPSTLTLITVDQTYGVYADALQSVFTDRTGLATRL